MTLSLKRIDDAPKEGILNGVKHTRQKQNRA
jgi:hypothetical protein